MGYSKDDKSLDADVLRQHIFGEHVKDYMEEMQEEAPEKYQSHFSKWIEAGIEPDDIEDLYKSVSMLHVPLSKSLVVCMGQGRCHAARDVPWCRQVPVLQGSDICMAWPVSA